MFTLDSDMHFCIQLRVGEYARENVHLSVINSLISWGL